MSLPALPTELLELIAAQVDVKSLSVLRLTSRALYQCTSELFADKIANKRWLLRATSLETLRAAASKPELKNRLTTFRLGTHGLTSWVERPDEPLWRDTWDAELTEQHLLTWRRAETRELMGQGAVMLASILQDLPALRRIEVGEWCAAGESFSIGHGGLESRNGTPQHLNVLYRSKNMYSENVLRDGRSALTIVEAGDRNRMWSRLSECFQHILHALTIMRPAPGTPPLERLSAVLYDGRTKVLRGILTDEMQKLKQGSNTFKALQPALAKLRELSLAVEVDGLHWATTKINSKPETWLSVFMKLVPSLKFLRLFYDDRFEDGQTGPYHRSLRLFLRETRLQYLARLKLACAEISESYFDDFLDFCHHHARNLTHLTLTCMRLSGSATAQNSWTSILEEMRHLPFQLASLKLQGLYGPDHFGRERRVVIFSKDGAPWGCGECLTSRRRDVNVGSVALCGHTTWESHTGEWPTLETMRVCERYGSFP